LKVKKKNVAQKKLGIKGGHPTKRTKKFVMDETQGEKKTTGTTQNDGIEKETNILKLSIGKRKNHYVLLTYSNPVGGDLNDSTNREEGNGGSSEL